METSQEAKALIDFVNKWDGVELFSTDRKLVNFSGVLYNVDGSSDDPEINGHNWRQLLINHGVTGNCYVTNVVPRSGTSHPGFNVGGHMTVNPDGSVEIGGTCYLMPLCSWHNHKSRDGKAFNHDETMMLRLFGYMEGEPSVTFMARLPNDSAFSIVSLDDTEDDAQALSAIRHADDKSILFRSFAGDDEPQNFVLFKRVERDDEIFYVIDDARLPS